ncbi:MAG: hypothetical protein JW706_09735 [Opitutales bacterium]|nr:hypothetical protein [Opitutales bacterium]
MKVAILLSLSLGLSPSLSGQASDSEHSLMQRASEAARKAVTLYFNDNPVPFEGYFRYSDHDTLIMWRPVGREGEVESTIEWHRIRSVAFPDAALATEIADAIECEITPELYAALSVLVDQRLPYSTVLSPHQTPPLVALAKASLREDNPTRTLGIIRAIRLNPAQHQTSLQIEYLELEALLMLGLQNDIIALANGLIAKATNPSDATFAWIALAWTYLKANEWYPSLMAASHALVFGDTSDIANTADAAFIALIASLHLGKANASRRYRTLAHSTGQTARNLPGFPSRPEWDRLLDDASYSSVEAEILNQARIQAILHPEQSDAPVGMLPTPILFSQIPDNAPTAASRNPSTSHP